LATLLFGIIEGPEKGWTNDIVVTAFAIASVAIIGFVRWELHTAHPMLDMSVFRNPRFSSASSTITLTFFALFGSMFLMTQYWQLVHGYSPLEAGVRLVPHAMTMMIVAPLSARFVERLGTKRVVTAGLSLIALGLALMSTIHAASPYLVVISYFLIMSVGMGMTMAPATESVMGSLPRAKAGVGSAVNDTTRQVGGALGVAIIGSVVSSVYAADIASIGRRFGIGAADLAVAESSLGGAQRIAPSLGERSDAFLAAANDGFVHSLGIGLRIAAAIIVFAAVMAWRFLPAHARSFETLPVDESGTDKIPVGRMAAVAGD
jgi:predicted MFS family arabinose efflux permease